jgi:hypothetical protein
MPITIILALVSLKAYNSPSRNLVTRLLVVFHRLIAMPVGAIIANVFNENEDMLRNEIPPFGNTDFDLCAWARIFERGSRQNAGDGDDSFSSATNSFTSYQPHLNIICLILKLFQESTAQQLNAVKISLAISFFALCI